MIARSLAALALTGMLWLGPAGPTIAASPEAGAPASVHQFIGLMDDPAVRAWLKDQLAARDGTTGTPATDVLGTPTLQDRLAAGVADLREGGAELIAAAGRLPGELAGVLASVRAELHDSGFLWAGVLILAFASCGAALQYGVTRATRDVRRRVLRGRPATAEGRLAALGARLLLALLGIMAFAVGSIGAFAVFDWPPLLKLIVLTVLAMVVLTTAAATTARLVIAPANPERRLLPLSAAAATFAYAWFRVLTWFAIGAWLLTQLLLALGQSPETVHVVAALLGALWVTLALIGTWRAVPHMRRYRATAEEVALAERTWGVDDYLPIGLSFLLPALWLLWALGAHRLSGSVLLLLGTLAVLWLTRQIIGHVAEPPDKPDATADAKQPGFQTAALAARMARSLILVGAGLLLLRIWGIELTSLAAEETVGARLLRGAVEAVLILLVADLALHALKATVESRLAVTDDGVDPDQMARRARLRTLLPIVRNVAMIVIAVMAVLTVLSSLGVEIGPLLAGAGVVGVAIGFGSQTLVKDIISGFFFLLDDAFRVGEYIESGSNKGTVESFSLRSIKLRHQRGPLYTVPFGALGAIVNHSRDWVIDKLALNVTYDTDLEQVKRLIKQIGKELLANPAFAPDILQTLKMQGVDQMGDFAIKIRLKMMTRPGRQFMIRRRAYALIKDAFAQNGIRFATPIVRVAGDDVVPAAAAAVAAAQTAD